MRFNSYIPRSWIVFLQVFGTILSVIGLTTYIFYMSDVSNSISSDDVLGKVLAAMILTILFYLTWKSIYASYVIINFIKNSSDDDISNNRFIISALSLNLGGFMTPFILTSLPNVAVQSTINPKYFLSKVMGIGSTIGSIISIVVLFSALTTGTGALTGQQIFDGSTQAGAIAISIFVINLVILALGAITIGMFYGAKKTETIYENEKSSYSQGLKVVSYIWMVIITVELALTIVFAIVRVIGALQDLFAAFSDRSNNFGGFFYILLSMANFYLTMLYVAWIVKMTVATINGIWSDTGINYNEYEQLAEQQLKTNKSRV